MNISDTLRMMHGIPPVEAAAAIEEEGSADVVRSLVSGTTMLDHLPLAMSYVPMQSWGETYEGLKALDAGTIFPELDLPFCGRRLSK